MPNPYCERMCLNSDTSPSTGSIVAYDGLANWGDANHTATFLEVADCSEIVRLHQSDKDTTADMIAKLERMYGVIGRFIEHLRMKDDVKWPPYFTLLF